MIDRLLDEMRLFVREGDRADPYMVSDVAAEYAEACAKANHRLRTIDDLLRRGLRTEALQLAEQSPPILDHIRQLTFDEHIEWGGLLFGLNIQQPPLLLVEIADRIEAALTEERSLERLLDKHRVLALARAPLPARIRILRRIRHLEPKNPVWQADLEVLENQRLRDMRAVCDIAVRRNDLDALEALQKEINEPWVTKVPAELSRCLHQALTKIRAQHAQAELPHVVREIVDAHADRDIERARSAQQRFRELSEWTTEDVAAPPVELPADAAGWLTEENQRLDRQHAYAEAIAIVEQAMATNCPLAQLQERVDAACRFGLPLPAATQSRVNEYVRRLKATRRAFLGRRVALVAAVAVAAFLVIALLTRAIQRRGLVHQAAQHLQTLCDAQDYDQAKQYVDGLAVWIYDDPRITDLRTRVEQGSQRKAEFAAVRDQLDSKPPTLTANEEQTLLARLKELAQSSAEVEDVRSREAAFRKRYQDELAAYDQKLGQFESRMEALFEKPWFDRVQEWATLRKEIQAFCDANNGFPSIELPREQAGRAKALLVQIDDAIAATRVTTMVDQDVDGFVRALTQYANESPDDTNRSQAQASVRESRWWRDSERWFEMQTRLRPEQIVHLSAENFDELVRDLEDRIKANPNLWLGGIGTGALYQLRGLRESGDSAEFRDMFHKWVLRAALPPAAQTGRAATSNRIIVGGKAIQEPASPVNRDPRAEWATRVSGALDQDQRVCVEGTFLALLEVTLADDLKIDGSTRINVIRELMKVGRDASPSVRTKCKEWINKLDQNSTGATLDTLVADLRRGQPTLKSEILEDWAVLTETAGLARDVDYHRVGWLHRRPEMAGKPPYWQIAATQNLTEGELYCLASDAKGTISLVCTGAIDQQGRFEMRSQELLQAGRPVFMRGSAADRSVEGLTNESQESTTRPRQSHEFR